MGLAAKVFQDSGYSGVRVAASTTKAIVVIPIITKLLGADSYGIWATILAFISLVASVGGIHLHGCLIRFSTGTEEKQAYSDILLFASMLAVGFASTLLLIGALFDVSFLLGGWDAGQAWLVLGASLLIFTEITLKVNVNFPRSEGLVKHYELLRIGREVLDTVVLASVFFLGGTIVAGIFGLVAVGMGLNVIIVAGVLLTYHVPRPRIDNYPEYVRYGLPMVPAAMSNRLLAHADKYLILFIISPTAVGIYAVAHSVCAILTDFTSILNPTLYPSVSKAWDEGNMEELERVYRLVFRYFSVIVIPAFLGLTFLAHDVLVLLSTPEIADQGAPLVPILALGFVLRGYDNPLEYILTSTKDTGLVAKATMISAGTNVLLNVGLIYYVGIVGAAVGTTVSHAIAFLLIYRYAKERFRFELPLATILRATVSGTVMLGVLYVLPVDLSPVLSLLLYPPLGAGVYFATLFLAGEFDRGELERVLGALR